jgi:Mn2+/Fe2+ NRAMP family transporter
LFIRSFFYPFLQLSIVTAGVWIFALGFVAAALSSMLAVPLGAALTVDSVFCECEEEKIATQDTSSDYTKLEEGIKEGSDEQLNDTINLPIDTKIVVEDPEKTKKLPRPVYWGIISIMVVVALVVISCNAPRVHVILIAQVFNGCLLPFFAICLLICLNDPQFMSASPQKLWANIFLVVSVTITLILAANVLTQKLIGAFLPMGHGICLLIHNHEYTMCQHLLGSRSPQILPATDTSVRKCQQN